MRGAVLLLSCIDPMLRDAAIGVVQRGLPDAVVVCYDVDPRSRGVRRRVSASTGTVEEVRRSASACPICAVRDEALVTIRDLAARGARSVIVALPVAMSPMPLALGVQYSRAAIVLAGSAAVVDAVGLADDLLGADLLADRGVILGRGRRGVARAIARQLETADVLLTVGPVSAAATALLDHVAGTEAIRCELARVNPTALVRRRRPARLSVRGDLRLVEAAATPDRNGVWSRELVSAAPFHPQRLLDRLAVLSSGRVRGRGYFWLPGTPAVQYGWDAAGGRPRIELLGQWAEAPHTRLVVTGDDDSAPRITAAFAAALMTHPERATGPGQWAQLPVGLHRRMNVGRHRCAAALPEGGD